MLHVVFFKNTRQAENYCKKNRIKADSIYSKNSRNTRDMFEFYLNKAQKDGQTIDPKCESVLVWSTR